MNHQTNKHLFEKELIALRVFLTSPILTETQYSEICEFVLYNPLMKCVEEILASGVRNCTYEQGDLLEVAFGTIAKQSNPIQPRTTDHAFFEKDLAAVRAILTNTPSRNAVKEEEVEKIRGLLMDPRFFKCVEEVLASGVRNIVHEQGDATEFALSVNLN